MRNTRKQDPGKGFKMMTQAQVTSTPPQGVRRIYVPSGDVTVVNDRGETIVIPEANIDAVNNQATFYNEVTSITGSIIYVSF